MIGINVICVIFEIIIMFLLAEYWKATAISLENGIRSLKLRMESDLKYQVTPIVIWGLLYIAFFIYSLFNMNDLIIQQLLLYGCQGVTMVLFLWGIIAQTVRGFRLLRSLKRCEEMLEIELDKRKVIEIRCSSLQSCG